MDAEAEGSTEGKATPEFLSDPEKFGDDEKICRLLETGKIKGMVNIDDVRPELKGIHGNEVDLADIDPGKFNIGGHIHEAFAVEIESGDMVIQGIFKPLDGENDDVKDKLHIQDCYKRERAAHVLDRFLGFGLVPPTVIRKINGKIGSLQLYVPPEIANNRKLLSGEIDKNQEMKGRDWQLMAAFDYISGNWERKLENWLVNRKDNSQLYAIDHGYAFHDQGIHSFNRRGPRLNLTYDNQADRPINTQLPKEIASRVQDALRREADLRRSLKDLVPPREIDDTIVRMQRMVEAKKFL